MVVELSWGALIWYALMAFGVYWPFYGLADEYDRKRGWALLCALGWPATVPLLGIVITLEAMSP